jgi:hypothetical protein
MIVIFGIARPYITASWPPSITSASPWMNDASSEARNAYAAATSSGVPARPSGIYSRS